MDTSIAHTRAVLEDILTIHLDLAAIPMDCAQCCTTLLSGDLPTECGLDLRAHVVGRPADGPSLGIIRADRRSETEVSYFLHGETSKAQRDTMLEPFLLDEDSMTVTIIRLATALTP